MTVQELLDLRDRLVNRFHPNEGDLLELDLQPFTTTPLRFVTPKHCRYLNRYLSSKLFQDPRQWLESLFSFAPASIQRQLLINGRIQSQQQLSDQVKKALTFVSARPQTNPTKIPI